MSRSFWVRCMRGCRSVSPWRFELADLTPSALVQGPELSARGCLGPLSNPEAGSLELTMSLLCAPFSAHRSGRWRVQMHRDEISCIHDAMLPKMRAQANIGSRHPNPNPRTWHFGISLEIDRTQCAARLLFVMHGLSSSGLCSSFLFVPAVLRPHVEPAVCTKTARL
jgi:hypothetical protein